MSRAIGNGRIQRFEGGIGHAVGNANIIAMWFLVTIDTPSAVEAADVFNPIASQANVGDVIFASMDVDGTPVFKAYIIASNDGTTVVVTEDDGGNLAVGVGGSLTVDDGTATAVATAATLNKMAGKITSEALTTAGLAAYGLTLTNSEIVAGDIVLVSVANGTNSQGTVAVGRVTPGAGSAVIEIENLHATEALNGTLVISFLVLKT